MRILHLLRSDGFAGVERYLTYVAPALRARGHEVTVVGGDPARMAAALEPAGVVSRPARTTLEVARAAVLAPRPDVVHAHMTAAELAAVLTRPLVRRPIVATLHFARDRGHDPLSRLAWGQLPRFIDRQVAISGHVAAATGPGAVVVPNAVAWPELPDPAPERRPVVLVAQRLEAEKGTDVALRAWAASGLADRGWTMEVAGGGAEATALAALADGLGVAGSVRFLGHVDDLPERLATVAVVLAPSPVEGFGLGVVEAMASATPVVAAAAAAHLETVGGVEGAQLFPPGDAAAAADRLRALATDPGERARYGVALRHRYEEAYTVDRHVDALLAVYDDAVARHPRRARPRRPAPPPTSPASAPPRPPAAGDPGAPPEPAHPSTAGGPAASPSRPRAIGRAAGLGAASEGEGRLSVALVFPGCHRRGGVERVVRELAVRLAPLHDVTFVGDDLDPDGLDGVRFLPVGGTPRSGWRGPLSFRRRATRALAGEAFDLTVTFGVEVPPGDLLHVNSVHRAWLAQGGARPSRWGAVPPWARYASPGHIVRLALERRYFTDPGWHRVVAVSRRTADDAAELYWLDRQAMAVVPVGYSPREFSPELAAARREEGRRALGLGPDDVALLLVANELHRKGFGTVLEAMALLDDRRVQLHVVGAVDAAPYRPRIDQLGLADRVHVHGPSADTAGWYALADLFVLPTSYEPFGLVVVEALACGLPVITTTVAGAADAVLPGVNGLLQDDPTDAAELAGLLVQGLDPATRERWRAAAPTTVAPFAWDAIAAGFGDLLRRTAAARPRP